MINNYCKLNFSFISSLKKKALTNNDKDNDDDRDNEETRDNDRNHDNDNDKIQLFFRPTQHGEKNTKDVSYKEII